MSRGTVMVVEDDRLLARAIDLFLSKRGYAVSVFHNRLDAQEYLHREQPDSAVIDIVLPDGDGWSIARLLGGTRQPHSVPVIVMSALTPDRRELSQSGVRTFVQKPFDMRVLMDAVDEAVGCPGSS